ncbi:MAG TPA: hypothetical protein VNX88_18010 [Terriglobales bacterium]|jgi:hypothetical protein|nr:hypothetical protein [Terriglobales bacterium]
MTLEECLNSANEAKALMEYAKKEFNDENIVFLEFVRKVNPSLGFCPPGVIGLSSNVDERHAENKWGIELIRFLYDHFIKNAATLGGFAGGRDINLSGSVFESVKSAYQDVISHADSKQGVDALKRRKVFDAAYREIYGLVQRDTYARFGREQGKEVLEKKYSANVPFPRLPQA